MQGNLQDDIMSAREFISFIKKHPDAQVCVNAPISNGPTMVLPTTTKAIATSLNRLVNIDDIEVSFIEHITDGGVEYFHLDIFLASERVGRPNLKLVK